MGNIIVQTFGVGAAPWLLDGREQPPSQTSRVLLEAEKCFYMNFKLLNIEEAFPKIMRAKLRSSGAGEIAVVLAGKGSQLVAKQANFGKAFSNKIADKLTELMPHKLEANGIDLTLTKVHCGEMGFIVLRAEVVDVDLVKLLEKAKGTEFAARLSPLVGMARRIADIDRCIIPKIHQQMMLKMETEIPSMMKEKAGFKMVMITKPSSEQADFFFDALASHRLEVAVEVPNRAEAALGLAQEHAEQKFGPAKLLGKAAGAVASHVVSKASDKMFGKLVARYLLRLLPLKMADAGVTLTVTETFADADQSGKTILRCEITDVDLDILRTVAGASSILATAMADGQHFLKLGRKGRSETYQAIRTLISNKLPADCLAEKGLRIEAVTRDVQGDGAPEMMDIDGLSDSGSDN
eukprot:TRINITY_DN61397_c0_g1_i1.p1 TRINITY_DN61397_c0_g1~~TRINITY_DN61397_c0_g1_i1.p1  ORF type:complete len:408 (-),score=92.45 TRINITY_DN61397_c0_g1_i1:110-1333(-)